MPDKAKQYSTEKYALSLIGTAYALILLYSFSVFGFSGILVSALGKAQSNSFILNALYLAVISLLYYFLDFPLNFYQSFILEHKFSLSRQKPKDWFTDQFKAGIISYAIFLLLISAFYVLLNRFPRFWWMFVSVFWIFFSIILARLTPTLIIPIFFKYRKLTDESLRERILKLAAKMQVGTLDCFEIDFSKKTLKANAAFLGWGKTKRVILADTLKDKYTHDEIEVILAHEFAHYKLKHILKLIIVNSLASILCFYLIFKTSGLVLKILGFTDLRDIASLPAVLIYFILFSLVIQPFENYISRMMEKHADSQALLMTGSTAAFISMMNKLSEQNLADRNPHPLIKFFFFDHPPIDERIAMAGSGSVT
jgi:STE24 endopeptidase